MPRSYVTLKIEYCPECGGEMAFDISLKLYNCKSCGLSVRYHEILELRKKNLPDYEPEDQKDRERKDYLKWWLTKKT